MAKKDEQKEQKPTGRPSSYTPEVGDIICERISNGESLRSICSEESMPCKSTVFRWLSLDKTFSDQYTRAKEAQAELLADEIMEISDDGRNDWMEKIGKDGESLGWTLNGEHVNRSRLRVDARKWIAAKLLPKKYGDRQTVDLGNADDKPFKSKVDVNIAPADAYRELLNGN